MRTLLLLGALTLTSLASAQMPLPNFGSTFTSSLTRGFWFQAPTTFVITGLRVPNEAGQAFQAVEIIDLLGSPPPVWSALGNGTQLFYDNSTPAGTVIATNLVIPAGAFIGILGVCTASIGATQSFNSYGTPAGSYQSNILGTPVTLTRLGTQFGISAGGNNPFWQEPNGAISRVEVYVAPAVGFASSQPFGTGCINVPDVSSYQLFPTAASFDLGNSSMSLLHTGAGYLAVPGLNPYVPPSPTAAVLPLASNAETTVALSAPMRVGSSAFTSSLTVCSNGFISAASGNGIGTTPSVATFLNGPRAWWSLGWHNFNPAAVGGGSVKFEEIAGIAYITWDGVFDSGSTTPNTMQAQFELATGTVHYVYGQMSGGGNGYLVGFSDAGPSADPGGIDISALLPQTFSAATFAVRPLAHASSARPVIGTTISLNTSAFPFGTVLGLNVLGLSEFTAGIDLTSIGMPGCNLYASLDALPSFLPVTGIGSVALPIPNDNSLAGVVVLSQGTALVPGINAFGFVASNGLRLTLDLN